MANQLFEIHFHHGGQLMVQSDEAWYEGGLVDKTTCDMDKISLPELIGCVKEFGGYNVNFGNGTINMRLWYRIPGECLLNGRRMVLDDGDVYQLAILACGPGAGKIDVYVDHGVDIPEVLNIQEVVHDRGPTQESVSLRRENVQERAVQDKRKEVTIKENKGKSKKKKRETKKAEKKKKNDVKKRKVGERETVLEKKRKLVMDEKKKEIGPSKNIEDGESSNNFEEDTEDEDSSDNESVDSIIQEEADSDDGEAKEILSEIRRKAKTMEGRPSSMGWNIDEGSLHRESDDEGSVHDSEEEEDSEVVKVPSFNYKVDMHNLAVVDLLAGMTFVDAAEFKKVLVNWSIERGYEFLWFQTSKKLCTAYCTWHTCDWRIRASLDKKKEGFQIKTVGPPHSCPRQHTNLLVNTKYITELYAERILNNPKLSIRDWKADIKKTLGVTVKYHTLLRAKRASMIEVGGIVRRQYARIRDYGMEILRSNPGSTVDISTPGEPPVFEKIYICFKNLRDSFLGGCRRFLCLDGAFLKGICDGQVLTAVGIDGNNQMFPVVWGVVPSETYQSWKWFITHLQEDLDLGDGSGWIIMTDQQKVNNLVVAMIHIPLTNELFCFLGIEYDPKRKIQKWSK